LEEELNDEQVSIVKKKKRRQRIHRKKKKKSTQQQQQQPFEEEENVEKEKHGKNASNNTTHDDDGDGDTQSILSTQPPPWPTPPPPGFHANKYDLKTNDNAKSSFDFLAGKDERTITHKIDDGYSSPIGEELAAEVAAFTRKAQCSPWMQSDTTTTTAILQKTKQSRQNLYENKTNSSNNQKTYLQAVVTSSTLNNDEAYTISSTSIIEQLQHQIKIQQREHLERIQQVQLKAYIAETKASAIEEHSLQLKDLLVDALIELVLEKKTIHDCENDKRIVSLLDDILDEVIDMV